MPDDEGVAPSVVRDLSQTIDASKNQTPIPRSSTHPILSPFGHVSVCETREEIVGTVGRLISDHLNKDDTTKASLITAFKSYFEEVGIMNDNDLFVMCADDWPVLNQVNAQKHIKIPVLRCLKTVAAYTRKIRYSQNYL